MCFLPKESGTSQKCVVFRNFEHPYFCSVFYHVRHGRQKKKSNEPRGPFSRFSGSLILILRIREPESFDTGMCDRTAGFYHVLSVFVVLSVSVESDMECQFCVDDVFFCAVSLSGTAVKSHDQPSKKNSFGGPRKPSACGPKHCRFSRTSHGCLPTSCDTRRSKVPAILRDWQELDAEQAVLELVPQEEVQGTQRWGTKRLRFDCAVKHCLAVFTSQPASVRRRVVQEQKKKLTPKPP